MCSSFLSSAIEMFDLATDEISLLQVPLTFPISLYVGFWTSETITYFVNLLRKTLDLSDCIAFAGLTLNLLLIELRNEVQ